MAPRCQSLSGAARSWRDLTTQDIVTIAPLEYLLAIPCSTVWTARSSHRRAARKGCAHDRPMLSMIAEIIGFAGRVQRLPFSMVPGRVGDRRAARSCAAQTADACGAAGQLPRQRSPTKDCPRKFERQQARQG